jgi:hypothetical protein
MTGNSTSTLTDSNFPHMPPDALADMVSIMVNKHTYKPSLQDVMDKYYEMFLGRIIQTKQTFSTVPTRTQMVN